MIFPVADCFIGYAANSGNIFLIKMLRYPKQFYRIA